MTLRKPENLSNENAQEIYSQDTMKLKKFEAFIRDIGIYLATIDADDWRKHFRGEYHHDVYQDKIGVVCGQGNSRNIYIKCVVENMLPVQQIEGIRNDYWHTIQFTGNAQMNDIKESWYEHNFSYDEWESNGGATGAHFGWRDDIEYDREHIEILSYNISYLSEINERNERAKKSGFSSLDYKCVPIYWNIFWNLFIVALDDEIFNNQMSNVADLAFILGFDEHMMRDWCRAVEYVLSGNRLSQDCNLKCDTIEGENFFLHKDGWPHIIRHSV